MKQTTLTVRPAAGGALWQFVGEVAAVVHLVAPQVRTDALLVAAHEVRPAAAVLREICRGKTLYHIIV